MSIPPLGSHQLRSICSVMSIEESSLLPNPHTSSPEERIEENDEENEGEEEVEIENQEAEEFHTNKRKKKSIIWNDFIEITEGGIKRAKCNHCDATFALSKTGTTTGAKRHQGRCANRRKKLKISDQQTKLNFLPSDECSLSIPPLHPGKFEMEAMRESAAQWVMMHEHPFSILEETGFNITMKRAAPEWQKVSRTTNKANCLKIYEIEKKKLKNNLELVNKISLTTDCWKSKNQKIEYMVVTGHWVDHAWRL